MKLKVEVNMENRPKGDPIDVPPLGVIKNGSTAKVFDFPGSEEEGEQFWKNAKDSPGIKVTKGGD
jgi:hypothetical protein